jgi:hypothetical protein
MKPILTLLTAAACSVALTAPAQDSTIFASGLRAPTKIIFSQKGNLLVAEQGTAIPNTGRISIIDPISGVVRTLLDGLPSGLNLIGEMPAPSGPDGLAVRGRTLYVTVGSGNTTLPGPAPGSEVPNPNPSSPLFSSVLKVQFSAALEMHTSGFTLTDAQRSALAAGQTITLGGKKHGGPLTIQLVANFPDYVPAPRPGFPDLVVSSNPFGLLVGQGDQLDVVDASLNEILLVDGNSGATATLVHFDDIANTLFPNVGPPMVQPVPDSIQIFDNQFLVPYLTGFPFGPGAARVQTIDPNTGANQPFITGLTAAIDVLTVPGGGFLVLEFGSAGLQQPGRLLYFSSSTATPEVISSSLITPTNMVLDENTNTLFITEIGTGRIIRLEL